MNVRKDREKAKKGKEIESDSIESESIDRSSLRCEIVGKPPDFKPGHSMS